MASKGDIRLYRGISVREQDYEHVRETVLANGLSGEEGWWKFDYIDFRPWATELLTNPSRFDEIHGQMKPLGPAICACGDEGGAAYYACKHNQDKIKGMVCPVVVVLEVALDRCAVDCRDFLCTVFQLWDRLNRDRLEETRGILRRAFGAAVLPYFDLAASDRDQRKRIGLCNLRIGLLPEATTGSRLGGWLSRRTSRGVCRSSSGCSRTRAPASGTCWSPDGPAEPSSAPDAPRRGPIPVRTGGRDGSAPIAGTRSPLPPGPSWTTRGSLYPSGSSRPTSW